MKQSVRWEYQVTSKIIFKPSTSTILIQVVYWTIGCLRIMIYRTWATGNYNVNTVSLTRRTIDGDDGEEESNVADFLDDSREASHLDRRQWPDRDPNFVLSLTLTHVFSVY